MDTSKIYLDYAASTPLDATVFAAMQPYLISDFYNPSAGYQAARHVRRDIETARARIAFWLGSKPSEIVFCAGATEANNMAVHGIMRRFPTSNMVISSIEHDSVRLPAACYTHRMAGVSAQGIVELADIAGKIDDDTVLVSVMYANNEIGTIQPLRAIGVLIKKIKEQRAARGIQAPLYFHTDAAQAANYLDLHMSRLGVDLASFNGGKIYGPKQSGILYVKAGIDLEPLFQGGGQEHNLRSGTENVAGCIGLSMALDLVQQSRQIEVARLKKLREEFTFALQRIDGAQLNGSFEQRLPNNVHVTFLGQDNERLLFILDQQGIMAAAGSACSASDETSSHVLRALGMSDETARSSLRFTMGQHTTSTQLDQVMTVLRRVLA